ncbi:MAG: hypothetical protein QOG97_1487 [Acidimicrobiaceae bacterium]|nr:hypothetical protein [Acidimicrobiaceae bacterium]
MSGPDESLNIARRPASAQEGRGNAATHGLVEVKDPAAVSAFFVEREQARRLVPSSLVFPIYSLRGTWPSRGRLTSWSGEVSDCGARPAVIDEVTLSFGDPQGTDAWAAVTTLRQGHGRDDSELAFEHWRGMQGPVAKSTPPRAVGSKPDPPAPPSAGGLVVDVDGESVEMVAVTAFGIGVIAGTVDDAQVVVAGRFDTATIAVVAVHDLVGYA